MCFLVMASSLSRKNAWTVKKMIEAIKDVERGMSISTAASNHSVPIVNLTAHVNSTESGYIY